MPHLYLDMDGVQADFFGAWADRHNVASFRDIADPEAAIDALAASGPKAVYDFFVELRPLPGGQRIIQWLHQHKIAFTVLSAPLRGEAQAAIKGKRDWLEKHNPGTAKTAIFTSQKHEYATLGGKSHVLVDDFGKYLNAWSSAGGIAVKHDEVTTDHTIATLEKIYTHVVHSR